MAPPDSLTAARYRRLDLVAASLLTLAAFFLRTYHLAATPPAFDYDEAAHAIDALQILGGDQSIFSTKIDGIPTFFMYLEAGFFTLLGVRTFAARLMVAFAATLTVPLLYLLGRRLFMTLGARRCRVVAGLGAFGLATSHWHLNYSRTALEYALVPFFAIVVFLLLWLGLRSGKLRLLALGGAWLGLSVYVYHTPRLLPIVVVLFLVWESWAAERGGARIGLWRALATIALPAIVVFAPLGGYFALHPDHFLGRASHTMFTNPEINDGNPWGALLRGAAGTFGAFGVSAGDFHPQANLPGKPILDPAMAILFGLGLIAAAANALRGRRERRGKGTAGFLLLAWWLIMLVPAAITPDRVPNFARMLSVAPPTYLLAGLGADALLQAARRVPSAVCRLSPAILAAALVLICAHTATATWNDYFGRWAPSEDAYQAFHGPAEALARRMNADREPGVVYVLPCDPLAGDSCDYYSLDFFRSGGAPHRAIRMTEENAPVELTQATAGKQTVRLVYLKKGKRKFLGPEGDPKEMLAYWLGAYGRLEQTEPGTDFDVATYRLSSPDTRFVAPVNWRRVDVPFGDELWLRGASLGLAAETAESGGNLPVALRWVVLKPPRENYRATLRVTDSAGHLVAQVDRLLMHYGRRRASKWLPEDSPITDFSLIPLPPTLPPGPYTLSVGLYPPSDESLLPIDDQPGRTLREVGVVQVSAPAEPPDYRGIRIPNPIAGPFAPSLEVAGYSLDSERVYPPGGRAVLSVFWHTLEAPRQPVSLSVRLEGGGRGWDVAAPQEALGADAGAWQPGRLWQGLYDLAIPADVPHGKYTLRLLPLGQAGTPIDLASVEIGGRPRQWEAPPMTEALQASFGPIELLGLDPASSPVRAGQALALTLHWRATEAMQTGYTLFLHLVDDAGYVRAQRDAVPADGNAPTTGWLPGEVITEQVVLPLPGDLAPGPYRLLAGWYDAATGVRLSGGESDYVELQSIDVK